MTATTFNKIDRSSSTQQAQLRLRSLIIDPSNESIHILYTYILKLKSDGL
jgi:hypothetical protein